MPVNFLDLLANVSVDLNKFEGELKKAEELAEKSAKAISGSMNLIGIGIVTSIAGAAIVALEKAVKKTAEWGLEMEHLSNRMGMTVRDTATVVGVMERFGVNANMGARAMQMLSTQVHQTQNSLDPLSTRLGKTLGALRDTSGHALAMGQVLDLVRQKVSGASSDSERLQIATSLLGARIGGQLIPMLRLSNEEWEKQKASVQSTLGPVEQAAEQALAYKQATAELEQVFRGLEITIGTKVLPALTDLIRETSAWIKAVAEGRDTIPILNSFVMVFKDIKTMIQEATYAYLYWQEKLGLVEKGTAAIFANMEAEQAQAAKAGAAIEGQRDAAENLNTEIEMNIQNERKLAAEVQQQVRLMEKARQLGVETGGRAAEQAELERALNKLTEERLFLEDKMKDVKGDQRIKYENDLLKNRVDAAQLVSDFVMKGFKEEELQLKANGALNLSTEINLLERKLSDERIVGDERLKIEAELYNKRKQFLEEAMKVGQQLGLVTVDQEIAYRKQRFAELQGKGDVIGAAQELVKARDLAIKQADQVMEFTKKLRIVAINDEIRYQEQKLALAKGNAEEEMKILSRIADLDKNLYDRRLQFALDYNQKAIDSYRAMLKATGQKDTTTVSGPQESLTFAQREREAERARFQQARLIEEVAMHGGTEAEISAARKAAEQNRKDMEEAMALGKSVSDGMKEIANASKDFFKAASGGEEVRAPGGPSPVVGSLMSPAEGLATEALARGSDIPRLDTSFTDLAVRIRDVLLGTIPNIQNFSNQLALATKQMAQFTGTPNNPGIIGPGGGITNVPVGTPPATGFGQVTGGPTAGPGAQQPVTPSSQVGVGTTTLDAKLDALTTALVGIPGKIADSLNQSPQAGNLQSLVDALHQAISSRQGVNVQVGVDPNTGDLIINRIVQEISAT